MPSLFRYVETHQVKLIAVFGALSKYRTVFSAVVNFEKVALAGKLPDGGCISNY